jgi:cryptochrome
MEGNPLCKQIPWDNSSELVAAWKEGRTGYPWIDACMVQLKQWVSAELASLHWLC